MPDPRDLLPQPPWEGLPIPRGRYRPKLTPADLYGKISGSFTKSESLIEESWVDSSLLEVLEFYGDKLKMDVERQIDFLQAFLRAIEIRL